MNGVHAIRQLLVGNSAVTNLVPAARIQADVLPPNTALPAIHIQSIDDNPLNPISAAAKKHIRERVQVSPLADDYPTLELINAAVLAACADKFPTVSGVTEVSVIADGQGPDGFDVATNARTKPRDFIVRYNRAI